MWPGHILGHYILTEIVTFEDYPKMLGDQLMPQFCGIRKGNPQCFQQDEVSSHTVLFLSG